MKITLSVLLVFITFQAFSQIPQKTLDYQYFMSHNAAIPDSLRLQRIELNLYKFSNEYRTGTTCTAIGIVLTGIGTAVLVAGNEQDQSLAYAAIIAGSVVFTIGWGIHIDSHKFIRRASGIRR